MSSCDSVPVEDGFCVAELLDFITKISLKRVKSVDDPDSALDRCTRELMALMINSSSVPLVDEAIRKLRGIAIPPYTFHPQGAYETSPFPSSLIHVICMQSYSM